MWKTKEKKYTKDHDLERFENKSFHPWYLSSETFICLVHTERNEPWKRSMAHTKEAQRTQEARSHRGIPTKTFGSSRLVGKPKNMAFWRLWILRPRKIYPFDFWKTNNRRSIDTNHMKNGGFPEIHKNEKEAAVKFCGPKSWGRYRMDRASFCLGYGLGAVVFERVLWIRSGVQKVHASFSWHWDLGRLTPNSTSFLTSKHH